jgi:CIC family chloride channel protein
LCTGSGGSAGAFRAILPVTIGPDGAYDVAVMAAVFGAATRAPFTAVIIVLEMTGDYAVVLPPLAAVSIRMALSGVLTRGTIYTIRLTRGGIKI